MISALNQKEKDIVRQCLNAAVHGPFFPDWEFQTLFGIDRAQVAQVLSAWPDVDESDESVILAINNSMGNLIGYPHGKDTEWPRFVTASREEVLRIFQKWKADKKER